jgi:hypothetical protein
VKISAETRVVRYSDVWRDRLASSSERNIQAEIQTIDSMESIDEFYALSPNSPVAL